MTRLSVNGRKVRLSASPDTPLLWALRDELGLMGTKYGCGIGACGACTVHVQGAAVRSCQVPLSDVVDAMVTTIESLSKSVIHPVQRAWIEAQVPQCGFCQSGQIMQAAALLEETPNPTDEQIDAAMVGVLCRCGTYPRIRAAIKRAAGSRPPGRPPRTVA